MSSFSTIGSIDLPYIIVLNICVLDENVNFNNGLHLEEGQ